MNLPVLPTPTSDLNKQRTGAHITIRSANSPSYALTRRPGIRKRESVERFGERENSVANADQNFPKDEFSSHQTGSKSCYSEDQSDIGCALENQMPTTNKTISNCGGEKGEHSASGNCGRTKLKENNFPSREKTSDQKTGEENPPRGIRADTSTLLNKRKDDLSEEAGDSVERTVSESKVSSGAKYAQDRKPLNQTSPTIDWSIRCQTLPSRFRSESKAGSRCTENIFGPKSSQSIQERIEKLYGATTENTAGGEKNSLVQSRTSQVWSKYDKPETEAPLSQRTSVYGDAVITGQLTDSYSEDANWKNSCAVDSGTKSLERSRSRNSLAAQIRYAKAAGEIRPFDEVDTSPDGILKDSNGFRKQGANKAHGSTKENGISQEGQISETPSLKSMPRGGRAQVEDNKKEIFKEAKEKTETRNDAACENLLKTNPKERTEERRKFSQRHSSLFTTSVRNKINQFEALTQGTDKVSLPRRAFSVPMEPGKVDNGVKSISAKEITGQRDKKEELKRELSERGKKPGPERSLSVDEVGLRSETMGTGEKDVSSESKKILFEDFGKYCRFKSTLKLDLKEGAQKENRQFHLDTTHLNKVPNKTNVTANKDPSQHSVFVRPTEDINMASPVSDGDKTPTNNLTDFPFMSLDQPKKAIVTLDTVDSTQSVKNEDVTSTPLTASKKQMLDMTAWIAGLKEGYIWDPDENEEEDLNYDSDSGDSSVTITSNMSQSDHRSYSLSLKDLCSFTGAELDTDNYDEEQLTGRRSASLSSEMSAFSWVSLLPTEELDRLLEDVRTLGDDALQDSHDVQVVVLHKDSGVGLGFSLAGGADQNKPIIVHKVFKSGVAAQEGSIREGDHVLSINGTALSGTAHWEALRILRKAKTQEMGVVVLKSGIKLGIQESNEVTTQTRYETGERVCVKLHKNNRDLGFSLEGGVGSRDGNRPLIIQKVFQGGPVDQVYPSDELLEINGMNMTKLRRLEAWTFIRNLPPGPVEVVLHRPKRLQT